MRVLRHKLSTYAHSRARNEGILTSKFAMWVPSGVIQLLVSRQSEGCYRWCIAKGIRASLLGPPCAPWPLPKPSS